MPCTMRGSFLAIIWPISIAASSSFAEGTTWFNNPMRSASSAATTRPVKSSSLAFG
jgi:hypothetical protein